MNSNIPKQHLPYYSWCLEFLVVTIDTGKKSKHARQDGLMTPA